MPEPVVQWTLAVRDPQKTARFLKVLFAWDSRELPNDPYTFVRTGPHGCPGAIFHAEEGQQYATLHIGVKDIAATLAEVVAKGGTILEPPVEYSLYTMAQFADLEGRRVGLIAQKGVGPLTANDSGNELACAVQHW